MKFPQFWFLVAMAIGAFGAYAVQTPRPPFTLALSATQSTIRSGAEVRVQIALTNISDHDLVVVREPRNDDADAHYLLDVHGEDGKPAPESALGLALRGKDRNDDELVPGKDGLPHGRIYMRMSHNIQTTLKPGESLKEECVISRFYDLTLSGKYSVQLTRVVPDEPSGTVVKSNVVTLSVW
jgi:hypothetical protein